MLSTLISSTTSAGKLLITGGGSRGFGSSPTLTVNILISTLQIGTIVTSLVLFFRWLRVRQDAVTGNLPAVNSYKGDYFKKRAHMEYVVNAKGLLEKGRQKFQGSPFRIISPVGDKVILQGTKENVEWIKNCKDVDHSALVAKEWFPSYPGFEAVAKVVHPLRTFIEVTKGKLGQSWQVGLLHEQMVKHLYGSWDPDNEEWHSIPLDTSIPTLISHLSGSIFVGPTLASNPQWQSITTTYTQSAFFAARALRLWPSFLRPLVQWFLPECKNLREKVGIAAEMLNQVISEREQEQKMALEQGTKVKRYEDTITWLEEEEHKRIEASLRDAATKGVFLPKAPKIKPQYEAAAGQLAFATGALHSSTQLLKQTIIHICRYEAKESLVSEIRNEVAKAVEEAGWSTKGLAEMKLLDSVIKETQRLNPGASAGLERLTINPVTLPGPSGTILPKGTCLAVDVSSMWSSSNYPGPIHASKWDPHRFIRIREAGGPQAQAASLVSTSVDHLAFGVGKFLCPGRFLAANIIKVAVAEILMDFDVRLKENEDGGRGMELGFEMMAAHAVLEIRKRRL